jgi:signal-transduction protein with cAMP-binding, CBS, and nucleotidyltransferase domain
MKKSGEIADREPHTIKESDDVVSAAKTMKDAGVTSLLVINKDRDPVGIITEKDLVYKLVAEHKSPYKTSVGKIMSSPLVTVDETTPVSDAITLMKNRHIRRLPVTNKGQIIGMLTLKAIVGNSNEQMLELADVELPSGALCPYCQSSFSGKEELSKHIDRLHLGSGLLEGDLRQW